MSQHYLRQLFAPESIAVFGASTTAGSVGTTLFANLVRGGYRGRLYAINPKYTHINGHPCLPDIRQIEDKVDLAVITTPRHTVAEILQSCGEKGVRAVIIISAGFGEQGVDGKALEQTVLDIGRRYQMRILGPNCLGLIHPALRLNATFSKNSARPGQLALVSQSGALCTAMLDWAEAREIGFSSIVSLGDTADIDFGDVLDYLAQDPETHSILLYVEGIRNARRFISGLRVAARLKPLIVLKAGRHEAGMRAAVTHTGAMVGGDDVFEAALERAGAVRALTVEQLFSAARLLASRYRVRGKRLAIITNGGGLGVMATDRAIDLDIEMATLSPATLQLLNSTLPAYWSRANPVDLLGDATPARYEAALRACLQDPGVDGVLVMLSPQAMTDGMACAESVITLAEQSDKPVMTCWMGGTLLAEAKQLFATRHIPGFNSPESCIEGFAFLAAHYHNQQMLMQVPDSIPAQREPELDEPRRILRSALAEHRTLLNITESKAILNAFSIPVTRSIDCHSVEEALAAAETLGYPVAMKILSPEISHKSDAGGVRLNITDSHTLRTTYADMVSRIHTLRPDANITGVTIETMYRPVQGRELMVGVIRDPVFGPVISFGSGGIHVEVLRDRALALPPLNTFLIRKMINHTRVAGLLRQYRNVPAIDMNALVAVLHRVSDLVCELPEIRSVDINPLIADENGIMALDARIEIAAPATAQERYAHMAIEPYPVHLVSTHTLADGTKIVLRPIRPEDATIEKNFIWKLSAQSRYFRFMQEIKELNQEMLVRFTQLDYDRELAMLAVLGNGTADETGLGVARYIMNPDGKSCEFALVVADEWQGKGIGTRLMQVLMQAARQRGFDEMTGEVITENTNMLQLVSELGFSVRRKQDDPTVSEINRRL
jgi:acetyltransferase